ncbi:hypothetical protein BGZ83_006754 [Gryganskiella cystojenkinii]|nr:hypothetical protein BGZ83_006754 [Gryganskiella cystojenkinii]
MAAGRPNISPSSSPHLQPQPSQKEEYDEDEQQYQQQQQQHIQRPISTVSEVYDLNQAGSSAALGQHHEFEHRGQDEEEVYQRDHRAASPQLDQEHGQGPAVDASQLRDLDAVHPNSPTLNQHQLSKYRAFRLLVMRMATVPRLQIFWGLLALFGNMSWMAITPAYAFRNKLGPTPYSNPSYTFFLIATVGTSLAAIWQSLCPVLIRQSQRSMFPRIINHPATQTTTIVVSVLLTACNFLSWIVLASYKDGAKTNCHEGPNSNVSGYVMQCKGVNVAIVLDVIVFLLWIPISLVIVCGTVERGLWWWGEDDGWAQGDVMTKGANMMSEEEFDMKIGLGGRSRMRRNNGSQERIPHSQVIERPKPAFVTPIASQFQSSGAGTDMEAAEDDFGEGTPSSYRRHHQQRQQPLQQQQQHHQQEQQIQQVPRGLVRKASNTSLAPSLSGRLSSFFGAGWSSGPMPPPEEQPPMPTMPAQYRPERSRLNQEHSMAASETSGEQDGEGAGDKRSIHGDAYATQWHNRRYDDWS